MCYRNKIGSEMRLVNMHYFLQKKYADLCIVIVELML